MNLTCKVFGHTPDRAYLRCVPGTIDGMGTEHAAIKSTCNRCYTPYTLGHIHLPKRQAETHLEAQTKDLKLKIHNLSNLIRALHDYTKPETPA